MHYVCTYRGSVRLGHLRTGRQWGLICHFFSSSEDVLIDFGERGREGERGTEPSTQARTPARNQAHDLSAHRTMLRPSTSRNGTSLLSRARVKGVATWTSQGREATTGR